MAAGSSGAGPQPADDRLVPEAHAWLLPGALSEEPRSAHGRGTEGLPRGHPGARPGRERRARRLPDDQGVRQLGGPRRIPSRLGTLRVRAPRVAVKEMETYSNAQLETLLQAVPAGWSAVA